MKTRLQVGLVAALATLGLAVPAQAAVKQAPTKVRQQGSAVKYELRSFEGGLSRRDTRWTLVRRYGR